MLFFLLTRCKKKKICQKGKGAHRHEFNVLRLKEFLVIATFLLILQIVKYHKLVYFHHKVSWRR